MLRSASHYEGLVACGSLIDHALQHTTAWSLLVRTSPLHERFGVEVHDVDLRDVTAGQGYPKIRELFEHHSLLLFRDQEMSEDLHTNFALLFGPMEDRTADAENSTPRERPPIPSLTNKTQEGDGLDNEDSINVLNLQGNQAWHTDSTFLHTPALANIITAFVVPSSGGETELATTRAPLDDMPHRLRQMAEEAVFFHSLLPSRIRIDKRLLDLPQVNRHQSQAWRAVWPNPVVQRDALYIARHVYGVRGMSHGEGEAFVQELLDFCTRPEYRYAHAWRPGDVLVWDERATVHRGRPWPYAEERTLASCCVSARAIDGLDDVRPPDGPIRDDERFTYNGVAA